MTVYIVTYDVSPWTDSETCQFIDAFATLEQAKAYIQKESSNEDDFRCYEIIEKTFSK